MESLKCRALQTNHELTKRLFALRQTIWQRIMTTRGGNGCRWQFKSAKTWAQFTKVKNNGYVMKWAFDHIARLVCEGLFLEVSKNFLYFSPLTPKYLEQHVYSVLTLNCHHTIEHSFLFAVVIKSGRWVDWEYWKSRGGEIKCTR